MDKMYNSAYFKRTIVCDTIARTSTVQCRASSCCGCCIIDSALSFATKSHLVGANCLLASFTHVENYSVTYAHIVLTPRLAPAARINAPFSASRIDPDTTYLAPSARINTHSLKCRIAPIYFWPNKKQHRTRITTTNRLGGFDAFICGQCGRGVCYCVCVLLFVHQTDPSAECLSRL